MPSPRKNPPINSSLAVASIALVCLLTAAAAGAAPRVLGAPDCEKCHKPGLAQWSQTEPAALGGKAHFNTHKQLAAENARKYAAAVGLADPTDPKGSCAGCHATVVRGRLRAGVSCESCHGAASDYLEVHDKEPWRASYQKSLPLGLSDLHEKPAAIAKLCVGCHVTPDARLAAAGHPNGAAFDAGASLRKIVHWTAAFTPNQQVHASYDFGQVSAAAMPLVATRLARGGGAPSAAAPARRAGASSTTPAPVAAAAPWDWDQPVAALPADYPSEEARRAESATPSAAAARPAAPSIAEDVPVAPEHVPATEPPPRRASEAAAALAPAAEVAQLRGRAAALLAGLLAAGRSAPGLDAPPPPAEFAGPDGELLHLQDVVLYLALETLRGPGE